MLLSRRPLMALILLAPTTAPASVAAQEAGPAPAAYRAMVACAAEADAAVRLACYDRTVAALAAATREGEVIVVDKAEVERRQRDAFGSRSEPALTGPDGEELDQLDSVVAGISYTPFGKLVLRLENGSVWRQLDSRDLARPASPGMAVSLRKAALGSYLANIGGQTAIRVRREN